MKINVRFKKHGRLLKDLNVGAYFYLGVSLYIKSKFNGIGSFTTFNLRTGEWEYVKEDELVTPVEIISIEAEEIEWEK